MSNENKEIYEFGSYRLDVDEHIFERTDGSANNPLPEKAFQTLIVLVRNQGRLLSKSELLEAVWPDTAVEENNLDKSIHTIRHALGDTARGQKFIETIRKHGYRFIADVQRVEPNGSGFMPESVPAAEFIDNVQDRQDIVLPGEIAASNDPETTQERRQLSPAVVAAVGLIAMLGAGAWLAKVALRPADPPIESAAFNLEKHSAMNSGAGRSPAYDLYVRGKVKLGSENREDTEAAIKVLEEAVAIDPNFAEAYAQLARGYNTMAFKYSSDAERKRFHENAEVAIEKALALNPDLAEGHFARGQRIDTLDQYETISHEQAIQSYKRSLALDPNLDETHHQLSLIYSHIGLLDEADESVKKALEINPNNTLARFRAGVYTAYKGKFDDALAIFKTIPRDFTPLLVDRSTAEALIQTGRLNEAGAIVDDYLSGFPKDEGGSFTSVKALLLAKAGKEKEAEEAIRRAVEIGSGFGHFHHTAYNIASAYAALNKPDEAVRWLEFAAENGFPNYTYFDNDPNLKNIRNHSRFIEFMKKLKPRWERFNASV